ncbi:Rrf2 family transcriptional regulator [Mucilaginibacter sp.]
MNNIEFATAIHILTLLAITGEYLSSSYIAGSININPAMVRKSLSVLRAQGFVEAKEGNGGGTALAKPAGKIMLSDIYQAVNKAHLLGKLNRPNPECKTGKQINAHLTELYNQADDALINKLSTITLADFCKKFN